LYQIHVRLGRTNTANSQSLVLQLNGSDLALCTQSDAHGHQNTAQITEIVLLDAGSVLTVACGANNNSIGEALKTRFTAVLLQDADEEDYFP